MLTLTDTTGLLLVQRANVQLQNNLVISLAGIWVGSVSWTNKNLHEPDRIRPYKLVERECL